MVIFAAAVVLVTSVVLQFRQVQELEERLDTRDLEIDGIADLIQDSGNYLSDEDLARVRAQLSQTQDRIVALEERSDAPARVLSVAAASVAFVQGSYGFVDSASGDDLRFIFDAEKGQLVSGPDGSPVVTIGGSGPVVEAVFTGTAFVATGDGLLLTNRHVALPWHYDQAAGQILAIGLTPVMRRFMAYLPGGNEPFEVSLVIASDTADLAVLRCGPIKNRIPPLDLSLGTQAAGEEILVLGYPTGIRALLARTDEELVDRLASKQDLDVWDVARELAAAGHIHPLASRGIVAQVTPSAVVFDAETTHGGSGGPVLDFEGRVVAVTSAIVPEFGGSNLGVPSVEARWLLLAAASQSLVPPRIR